MSIVEGAVPSPNIWHHEAAYEIENRALDPDGVIEKTVHEVRPWTGATVVDIGCGNGFHLPRFAGSASRIIGVEPHGRLVTAARRRAAGLPNVTVRQGAAQSLPVPDASVDVAHARWAYYFGPAAAPGLSEIGRVVRRGGAAFIIDNDPTRSTFGRWFARAYPNVDPAANDEFFSRHGYRVLRREIRWSFQSRADFETVVQIEFPPEVVAAVIAEHAGTEVDYAIVIRVKQF